MKMCVDVQKCNLSPPSSCYKSVLKPHECCECEYASLQKKEVGRHQSGYLKHAPETIFHTLRSTGQHCPHTSSIYLAAETMRLASVDLEGQVTSNNST